MKCHTEIPRNDKIPSPFMMLTSAAKTSEKCYNSVQSKSDSFNQSIRNGTSNADQVFEMERQMLIKYSKWNIKC